jgi:alpha-L-fucosidase
MDAEIESRRKTQLRHCLCPRFDGVTPGWRSVQVLFAALTLFTPCTLTAGESAVDPHTHLHVEPTRMAEWNDWRFGMFIHWGSWSQTGIGTIWKFGEILDPADRSARFDIYRRFNPEAFDPVAWARAARAAGMKYVVFVTKHHDGFNNFDTALSDYKVTAPECPWSAQDQPDLTRAVIEAFRAEGLKIGLYYSHIDWHHPDARYFSVGNPHYDLSRIESDPESWQRFVAYEQGQLRELLSNYGKIDIIWFDIGWPHAPSGGKVAIPHPTVRASMLETLALMKELQPDVIFNDRGTDIYGGHFTPEQRVPPYGLPDSWESSITITNDRGYWYKGEDVSVKSPTELIHTLINVVGKGGNFLMNVGPRPDGSLIPAEVTTLATIGEWMAVHAESIHGAERSPFHHLPWGNATTRDQRLYLHVFDWPEDGRLPLPGLESEIVNLRMLDKHDRRPLSVRTTPTGQELILSGDAPNPHAAVIVLDFDETPTVINRLSAGADGSFKLGSGRARIDSTTASYNYGRNTRMGDFIEDLRSPADRLAWDLWVDQPGTYEVIVDYTSRPGDCGGTYAVELDGAQTLSAEVAIVADWEGLLINSRLTSNHGQVEIDDDPLFKAFPLGTVTITESGAHTLTLRPTRLDNDQLMYLRHLKLVPVFQAE